MILNEDVMWVDEWNEVIESYAMNGFADDQLGSMMSSGA